MTSLFHLKQQNLTTKTQKTANVCHRSGTKMEALKKKWKSYTLLEKLQWIEEVAKPGMTKVRVAEKFGVTPSILTGALAKKEEIVASVSAGSSKKAKWLSQGLVKNLEDKLYTWFLKKRSQGLNMDRPLLRKQAETMAKTMGVEDKLMFSAGWLWRWQARYGVSFKVQHGEQQDADLLGWREVDQRGSARLAEDLQPQQRVQLRRDRTLLQGHGQQGLCGSI